MSTGSSEYNGTSLGGYPCYGADGMREHYSEWPDTTPLDWVERAACYINPLGPTPGRGWCLMRAGDVQSCLAMQEQAHADWTYTDCCAPGPLAFTMNGQLVLSQAMIIRATCMTPGAASDPSATMLVEFTDNRYVVTGPRGGKINWAANVRLRDPATKSRAMTDPLEISGISDKAAGSFGPDGSNPFTWQTLVSFLWATDGASDVADSGPAPANPLGAIFRFGASAENLDDYDASTPAIPYTPHGAPENLRFIGVTPWDALHQVLHRIGCTTSFNPVTNCISFVRLGTTQDELEGYQSDYAGNLQFDFQTLEDPQLRLGGPIRVMFPYERNGYGSETDMARGGSDGDNFSHDVATTNDHGEIDSNTLVAVNQILSVLGTSGGEGAYYADMICDEATAFGKAGETDGAGGGSTIQNDTYLQARAIERATNATNIRQISDVTMRQVYGGLIGLPSADDDDDDDDEDEDDEANGLNPGSQVKAIVYRDYGDQIGLCTELLCFPGMLRDPINRPPDTRSSLGWRRDEILSENEIWLPPDLARRSYMTWPHRPQFVQWTSATKESSGTYLSGTFIANDSYGTNAQASGDCWIYPLTNPTGAGSALGIVSGVFTDSTNKTRPIVTVLAC